MNKNEELNIILTKFAQSGWDVIDAPSKAWLETSGSANVLEKLIAAVEEADKTCGNCGCEFDSLYKKALELLKG